MLIEVSFCFSVSVAVDGCKKNQPGRLQLDWMEVQLRAFRGRGMKVWISGHVPPSSDNYFPDCFLRYGEVSNYDRLARLSVIKKVRPSSSLLDTKTPSSANSSDT